MADDGDMTDTTRSRTTRPNQRLERSREDRVLAGVAGGLGTHLGINADNKLLLAPDLPFQRAAADYARDFPTLDDSLLMPSCRQPSPATE